MMVDRIQRQEIERRMRNEVIAAAHSNMIRKQRDKLEEFRDKVKLRSPKAWSSKDFAKTEQILQDLSTAFQTTSLDSGRGTASSQASLASFEAELGQHNTTSQRCL